MIIDITLLNQNIKDEILLDEVVKIPENYLENTEIKGLKNVCVKGRIFIDSDQVLTLQCTLSGVMIILDSVSQNAVDYPFSVEIDENLLENDEKFENTLDILEILWQNIVLEVPLRFTMVTDYSKLCGDGWRVLSEDSKKEESNNPFKELESMFGKE